MDKITIWKTVVETLRINLSSANFSTWFPQTYIQKIKPLSSDRQVVEIACPSAFIRDTIENRYYGQIKEILDQITSCPSELVFVIKAKQIKTKPLPDNALFQKPTTPKQIPSNNGDLNNHFTFDNFVVGNSNNLAHAAAQGIVKNPGQAYNPFFIYGGVGVGKTHLMQAIGFEIWQQNQSAKVLYATAETFTTQLIASLQEKTVQKFKKKYREVDVFLVDDIQFIAGKEYSQEEFFHTFNSLYMRGKQIVLTADRRPEEIGQIEDRLISRFLGGLTVDVQAPDYEMRMAILKQKSRHRNKQVKEEVLDFIANQVESNARELEGTLIQVITQAETNQQELNLEFTKNFFGIKKKSQIRKITPQRIIAQVAKKNGFKIKELVGPSRKAPLIKARHIAMYLLRNDLELPLVKIGQIFANRDHTTVMHATEKIDRLFANNQELRHEIMSVRNIVFKQ
ncbi:chromosomal replication initiator protein DnaA [Patescibacteria group bacterium]